MATAHDVAAYILRKQGPMTAMKLQKLIYYCQAWSLAWDDAPLFDESIEAWANGPVIPALFDRHRGRFTIDSWDGQPSNLSMTQVETIDAVLETYGDKTSQWLSDLTHSEAPWIDARAGLPADARGHREITQESMGRFYSELASGA